MAATPRWYGYLHAATIVALADTAAGFGCVASLPDGASGFTTIELKSNHLGTVLEGGIRTEASLIRRGRGAGRRPSPRG